MSETEEGMRQCRAINLHEAGHVIVGLACGYRIGEVRSDGKDGHTVRIETTSLNARIGPLQLALSQSQITAAGYVEKALEACRDELTFALGGIAGESIELGRVALTVSRGSDDLASFFVLVGELTKGLAIPSRQSIAQDAFASNLDRAVGMVMARRDVLIAVADALEARGGLDEAAIQEVLQGARARSVTSVATTISS